MSGGDGTNPDEVARDRRALVSILGFEVGAEPWPDEACRLAAVYV